jgi:hypothetical protein
MMFVSFFGDDSPLDVHCLLMCLITLWCSFLFVLINPLIYTIHLIKIVLCLVGTCPTTCNLAFAYVLTTFWICVVAPRLTPMYHSGLVNKHIAKLLWNWFLASLILMETKLVWTCCPCLFLNGPLSCTSNNS